MRACLRACIHALLSVCVCVCLREARSAGGHLKSNGTFFDLAALLSLHSGVLSAAACQECAQAARPSFLPGHCSLHNPNNNTNSPTLSHTHSSHTRANFYPTLKYYRNTHTHTHRAHQKYSILSDNDDWCRSPPPQKKKKRSAAKQTVVGSINQLVGRGGTESPHWSSHRPNVSISKSFIPGTIFIEQHLPHWQGQRAEPATEQQRDRRGCRWCTAWSTWRCFTLSPWWLMGDGQVVRG